MRCYTCDFECCYGISRRAEGSALHASIGTMSGCLPEHRTRPYFLFFPGAESGAAGAGPPPLISNCACVYFLILLFVKRKRLPCA